MPRHIAFLACITVLLPSAVAAQGNSAVGVRAQRAAADSACSYEQCALVVVPSLASLDVVRGVRRERVARLGFFWAGDIRAPFAGSDSAAWYADRAVHTRRTASFLTDAGLALFAVAAVVVVRRGEVDRAAAGWATGGAVLMAASYPLQLRADGLLSSAVWWHNRQFAR